MSTSVSHASSQTEPPATQDDIRTLLARMGRSYTLRSVLNMLDHLTIAQTVQFGYLAILNRGVDPEGEKHYSLLLRTGTPRLAFLRDLASSPEFRGEVDFAHLRDHDDLHFLNEAHQRVLRRPIDAAMRDDLMERLGRSATREEVAAIIAATAEAQELHRFREEVAVTLRKEERKAWWRALLGRQIVINITNSGSGRSSFDRPASFNPDAALSATMNMANIQKLPAAARTILMQTVFGTATGNDTTQS